MEYIEEGFSSLLPLGQTLSLGIVSAANIGLAFLLHWYILTTLGPGIETDAFFAGMTVPQLVITVFSGSLVHVLVPLLAGEDEDSLRQNSWDCFALVGLPLVFICLLLYLSAALWIPVTVPGFSKVAQSLTIELARVQLVGMLFTALASVQWAVYHARQQFLRAEVVPLMCGLLSLPFIIWGLPRYGIVAVAWVCTLRFILQVFFMMPVMGTFVLPDLRSSKMRGAWKSLKPLFLGNVYYKTDTLIDRFLLSMSGSGTLSLFYLGQQFYGAGQTVINQTLVAPLVPKLSILHKTGDRQGFRDIYRKSLRVILIITGAAMIGFVVFGMPVLDGLVGWGAFRSNDLRMLWSVMLGLSGMFICGAAGQVTSTAFYATGNTRSPTILSVFSYTLFVPVKIICFLSWGIIGIAMATSIYYLVNFLLQFVLLRKTS